MPYGAVPMTPLTEWKDTEETLTNSSVFLINKNIERSIYLCVLRKKNTGIFKIIIIIIELLNCLTTQTQEATLREASMLVTLRRSLK